MSETQKWVASISGAVVGQLAILAFFYLLVVTSTTGRIPMKPAPEPKEVTVMLSQLLDNARREPPLPPEPLPEEPVPEEDPVPPDPLVERRQFMDTDANTPSDRAPERAEFESDRNTLASTENLPDDRRPRERGPTLDGDERLPGMTLADQQYFDGEVREDASPPPQQPQPESMVRPDPVVDPGTDAESADTAPGEADLPPETPMRADEVREGEADEAKPGEADRPPEKSAEEEIQPESTMRAEEAQMAVVDPSFVNPSPADAPPPPPASEQVKEEEKMARAEKETEEIGEPAAPEERSEASAAPEMAGESVDPEVKRATEPSEVPSEIRRKLDESMFNPAYLAHRRRTNQNGDITDLGEGSVDALATEVGAYKKRVNQAIGRKWHQYRQDRADHVTWGLLKVRFRVTSEGYVRDLKIVKKEASELVTEFSLRAIVDADIPPMPDDVAIELGPRGLEMSYNIIIY